MVGVCHVGRMKSPAILFLLLICACDCGEEPTTCVQNDDCAGDAVCVDGECSVLPDAATPDAAADTSDAPAPMCEMGEVACGAACCAVGETCGGGSCCAPATLCGGECCPDGAECRAEMCVLTCEDEETLCGEGAMAACCAAADVCYFGGCTTPGDACERNSQCPADFYCETEIGRCLPRRTSGETCEYRPTVDPEFPLVEEWSWHGSDVMPEHVQVIQVPLVANLTDDNLDGLIDENDIPDVVFTTFVDRAYVENGVMRALSGDTGEEIWTLSDPDSLILPAAQHAIADVIPASPGPEIITCTGRIQPDPPLPALVNSAIIISAAGEVLRRYDGTDLPLVACTTSSVAVADADHDGNPNIVIGRFLFEVDGDEPVRLPIFSAIPTFANIDDDPELEIVSGNSALNLDGTFAFNNTDLPAGGTVAVADLDGDGDPEIIYVFFAGHTVWVLDHNGEVVWEADSNPPGVTSPNGGGGPPTVANFVGDEAPEIALAGAEAYVVFAGLDGGDGVGDILWSATTQDRSSRRTGSSIFDFEGDGIAEAVYNDELNLHVYDVGADVERLTMCNTSGTLVEYPVVVDVDNDGEAEIILMENSYGFQCPDVVRQGIRVFGHPTNEWVATRRIWNQHTYHVTNINEDGTVPMNEVANWSVPELNNFRQNIQLDGQFNAPDLVVVDGFADMDMCPEAARLSVRVTNQGSAAAPAGVPVTFYDTTSARTRLGRTMTTRRLLPGESERVDLPDSVVTPLGAFSYEVVVNDPDDAPIEGVNECVTDNNNASFEALCAPIG